MTEPSDRELVRRIVDDRNEAAFRALYRRHTPILFRVASRLEGDLDASAEDLVHDTWIRAHDRWRTFEWKSSLRTWLTGILLNLVREARRAGPHGGLVPLRDDIGLETLDLDHEVDLSNAVARLPLGYRTAIVMHDIEGYSHEDIAACLGIEVGTSKSQLSRARRALRRWLEPDWSPS